MGRWPRMLGLLCAWSAVAHADAAIPEPPYLSFPADGATEVPLDVVVGVSQAEFQPPDPSLWHLRDAAGNLVTVTMEDLVTWGSGSVPTTTFRLRPAAPLAAGTRYQAVEIDGDVVVIAGQFTTGDGVDDGAPETPALARPPDVGEVHVCEYTSSRLGCSGLQQADVINVDLELARPAGAVRYTIRDGDKVIAEDMAAPLVGLLLCSGYPEFRGTATATIPPEWLASGGSHELMITARSLGGHVSAPLAVPIDGACDRSDEGTGALPPIDAGGGCDVTRGSRGGVALVLVGLALLLRRRRR